ncbi:DUF3577 domain-containing protein [Paraburkholderia sediminicola]|uniref:DUF3577 domain-containing protein n=1 Tax=Paraburkholderia rhynchosiae TaxID=487049 RepID=A0ACC7NMM8_9BURK
MDDANGPDVKVLASFRAGDHSIRTFERTGNRAGETGAVPKGRLLKLFWIKVDGQDVYRDESEELDDADAGHDQAPERVNGQVPSTHGPVISTTRTTSMSPTAVAMYRSHAKLRL